MALSLRPTKPTRRALSKLCERYLALPTSTRIGRAIRIAATQAFWRRYSSYGSDAHHYQPRFPLSRLILYRYSAPQLSSSRSIRLQVRGIFLVVSLAVPLLLFRSPAARGSVPPDSSLQPPV